jgi:hypothetical protein
MNWDETLALVSIGGFAVQRALDVLDFAIVPTAYGISQLFDKPGDDATGKNESWNVTELDVKKWLTAVVGFGIGLLITYISGVKILSTLNAEWAALDVIVGALAISGGSEGFNSVLKFANHAKEARKIEVRPLPEVKVTPAAATITKGTQIKILANVAGTDIKDVSWELLETVAGAELDPATGIFKAPNSAGIFHVAAKSKDNPAANAVATITVVA